MILNISLGVKAGVPKTLVRRKLRLHSLYFPQNSITLTEFSGEFSDLHSIFRLRALRYWRKEHRHDSVLVFYISNSEVNSRSIDFQIIYILKQQFKESVCKSHKV